MKIMSPSISSLFSISSIQSIQSIPSPQSKKSPPSRISLLALLLSVLLFPSCSIEPPLYLPQEDVLIELPITVTDLKTVWNINVDLQTQWLYGWDERDIEQWGELEYPAPTYFEVRRFYQGEEMSEYHKLEEAFTIYSTTFRRRYNYGYHDLLIWSNIDSKDGTQVVIIDEADADNVVASTTQTKTSYARPSETTDTRAVPLRNQPEVFYSGYERNFDIPRNGYGAGWKYDEKENVWVKELEMTLDPLVYIYLVQVVIHNNNGRIIGLSDNPTLTGMANSVNINTGWTSSSNADVVFAMRMKKGVEIPERNRKADIFGGLLTTFGLCDMPPWFASRADHNYSGSRTDIGNLLLLSLHFNNNAEKIFSYDVTDQMRRQAHGGIVTVEIDADTIKYQTPGGGFNPYLENYGDSIVNEFEI